MTFAMLQVQRVDLHVEPSTVHLECECTAVVLLKYQQDILSKKGYIYSYLSCRLMSRRSPNASIRCAPTDWRPAYISLQVLFESKVPSVSPSVLFCCHPNSDIRACCALGTAVGFVGRRRERLETLMRRL